MSCPCPAWVKGTVCLVIVLPWGKSMYRSVVLWEIVDTLTRGLAWEISRKCALIRGLYSPYHLAKSGPCDHVTLPPPASHLKSTFTSDKMQQNKFSKTIVFSGNRNQGLLQVKGWCRTFLTVTFYKVTP